MLLRWDKRRSARVTEKMRANLDNNQLEKAESQQSEATQETNQELGTTMEGEKAENPVDDDEDVVIVREVQKSASNARKSVSDTQKLQEN